MCAHSEGSGENELTLIIYARMFLFSLAIFGLSCIKMQFLASKKDMLSLHQWHSFETVD